MRFNRMMNPNRKYWNEQQQRLQRALSKAEEHGAAIELFLSQHAMVHSSVMSGDRLWSFTDEIWQDTPEAILRRIPQNEHHSIAWVFWHLARIEDVTMNLLIAASPQIFNQENWRERMNIPFRDTGNEMSDADIVRLSAEIDLDALQAYRVAVGRRTRAIVQRLQPEEVKEKVKSERLQRIRDEGAVVEAAHYVLDYWGKRTIAGLLLMPPTRHNFLHSNEALRLKQKRR